MPPQDTLIILLGGKSQGIDLHDMVQISSIATRCIKNVFENSKISFRRLIVTQPKF